MLSTTECTLVRESYTLLLVFTDSANHGFSDHCLDYIRQSVQCSGDLTTMTFNFQAARGRLVADFDALHTCRKFDSFHDWALERAIRYH